MMFSKTEIKNRLSFISILWIILSSNSLVYCIFNMKLCMAVLGIIAVLFLLMNKHVSRDNFYVFTAIVIVVLLNLLFNFKYTDLNEAIIILMIRCVCLMIIMSNIDRDEFVDNYVTIMAVMCIVSLICFILTRQGVTLPFQRTITFKNKYYIYTFYHTLGRWSIQERNCGIFWEPGGYQIFLNYGLLMLITDSTRIIHKFSIKRYIFMIAIFAATIMTTLSTTGFICFALILSIGVLHQNGDKKIKGALLALIAAALIAFLIIENNLGIIESKAINQEGSFGTRYNDTMVSFEIGLRRVLGYGYGNTYSPTVLMARGVTDNSSGLGSLLVYFGVIITGIYLIYVCFKLKKMFGMTFIESILAFIVFVLFIMSENVFPITLFVSILFFWKNEQVD